MPLKDTSSEIPYGYCHCGCGQKTKISTKTITSRGIVKGEPLRFIFAHHNRLQTVTPNAVCDLGDGHLAIALSRGYTTVIDADDYGFVSGRRWYAHLTHRNVYAASKHVGQPIVFLHRLIVDAPSGMMVDHEDHNGLNNTRGNIRLSTNRQNQQNRQMSAENTSGYKGICWHIRDRFWRANIRVDGRSVFLGSFDDPVIAARAYDDAAREYFGEFAALNFPKEGERKA